MTAIINNIAATTPTDIYRIVTSLANVPMTLESGLAFGLGSWTCVESTRFLMENSPFFITMTLNGGIELTNSAGDWLARTSPIIEAKNFDNGYCYLVTENGHKYNFTTFENIAPMITPVAQQKWMEKPVAPTIKQYDSFSDLPFKEKVYFKECIKYYISCAQTDDKCRYAFGELEAKRADYGFVNGIFCHISDSKENVFSLLNLDGVNVVGQVVKTLRGYKLCNYVFEKEIDFDCYDIMDEEDVMEDESNEYIEIMLSLETAAQDYYLKEVNNRIKHDIELNHNCAMKRYNKQMAIQSILGFHAITIKHEYDHRAYCDSKTTSIFEFSRPISREEFSSFLKEMGKEEKAQEAWYTPYAIINGEGDKWSYTFVNPYTD